jgi:hypothetical protein
MVPSPSGSSKVKKVTSQIKANALLTANAGADNQFDKHDVWLHTNYAELLKLFKH